MITPKTLHPHALSKRLGQGLLALGLSIGSWAQTTEPAALSPSVSHSMSPSMSHTMNHSTSPSPNTNNLACTSQEIDCANAATPWFLSDDTLLLVWTAAGSVMVASSKDMGKTFSPSTELAHHGQLLDTGSDARAQIVGDEHSRVLIAYSFFKDKNWNAQINFLRSADAGAHFSAPQALIKNGMSERFPSLGMDQGGRVYVSWVDKRWVQQQRAKSIKKLGGSIAMSYTDDWAESFHGEKIVNTESCECCRIAMDVSQSSMPVIAYRALFDQGIRDHAVQTFKVMEKTQELQASAIHPVANDRWQTDVCPHHGPSVTVSSQKTIHTVWFTQGQIRKGLFYARSDDGGQHFSAPLTIGDLNANESRPYILATGADVWMVWKRFDGVQSRVMVRHSVDDGLHWSEAQIVAQTSGYSDHPLLIKHQEKAYLSWLTRNEGFRLIELKG